jgi:hypothetical protein
LIQPEKDYNRFKKDNGYYRVVSEISRQTVIAKEEDQKNHTT